MWAPISASVIPNPASSWEENFDNQTNKQKTTTQSNFREITAPAWDWKESWDQDSYGSVQPGCWSWGGCRSRWHSLPGLWSLTFPPWTATAAPKPDRDHAKPYRNSMVTHIKNPILSWSDLWTCIHLGYLASKLLLGNCWQCKAGLEMGAQVLVPGEGLQNKSS